jgi:peptide/nickel transport system permease protein
MGRFAARRIAQGLIVILGVTITVFVVTRLVGDPVRAILPLSATNEERAEFRHQLGLDKPIAVQFGDYMKDVARLDFGESIQFRRPALDVVLEKLPKTFELVVPAIVLAVLLAFPLGVLAALKPGSFLDRVTVVISMSGLSIPQFLLGLLLILIFAVKLHLLPAFGVGDWRHYVLPVVTLALPAVGRLAMIVRSSMIDELNQQYVKMAKAKGMSYWRVVGIHALRNATIPAMTLTGWEFIRALSGYSVVVETVFAWPGLGFLAITAIQKRDLILLQAIVLVVSVMVVVINVLIDVLYKRVDPRIKVS